MYSSKNTGVGTWIREGFEKLVVQNMLAADSILYSYSQEGLSPQGSIKKIRLPSLLEVIFERTLSLHRIVWNFFFLPYISRRFNLVFSFSSHGSPFAKNQIIIIHDLICFAFPKQHRAQYFYFKYLLPHIIKSCIKIVTVSEYTKKEVMKYYRVSPDKIEVIYGAADHVQKAASALIPQPEQHIVERLTGKQFFLAVGASYKHKNIETLIAAMELLNNDNLLVIVGADTAYYRFLKQQHPSKQILFLSYVSLPMLGYLYKHCIANVYVSLYEGMGLPPYEAAVYNTVTIASNRTAIPEIYGDALYYVDPLDVNEISYALSLFSSGKVDKEQYQSRFPAILQKYTWWQTTTKLAALISQEAQQASADSALSEVN